MYTRVWLWFLLVVSACSVTSTVAPPKECYPIADLVFLADGSDSISHAEFTDQKTFIRRFVEMSDIGADKIRIGFAVVSSWIGNAMNLTSGSNKGNVLAEVDAIKQQQEGSRTDVGIAFLDEMLYSQGRLGSMYIGIILSDGRPKYPDAMLAEADVAKKSGVFLITIGVGRHIQDELLKKMASTPSNSYHMKPMDYSLILLRETVKYLGKEWCSDIVTGLPPNSQAMKQKPNFTDLGSGSNVSNISQDVSLLSKSEVNTNENITEGKKHHALTNAQNIIMGEEKQAPSIDSHDILTRESKGTLPHTTVFPVTRSNLGKILQALVNSKRANAQGIAFVKSRQDLKDALRILFISRGLGLNIMNRTLLRELTGPQMIKTSSETTERLTNVLPTSKPAITTLTRDSYGGNEELPIAKDLQIQYRNLNTESQIGYLPQQVKATVPTIFKQAQLHPSTKLNQFQSNSEAFKEKTKTAPSHGKTVVKPTISSSISSFEEEMLIGANDNPKIVEYNVKGQNTTKSFDIREKSIREKSHSKMTESSTVSNAITMKTEADAISINRLEAVLSDIHGIKPTRPTADAISVKRPERVSLNISGQATTKPSEIQTLSQSKVTESNIVSNSIKMKSDADYNSIKRLLAVVSDIHGIKTTTPTADAISIKRPEPVSSGIYEETTTRPVEIKSISQSKMTESNTISNSINKNSGSYYNTIKRLVTVLSDINGLKTTSSAKIKTTSQSAMQELSILSKLSQLKQEANSFLDKRPVPMSSDIAGQTATKPVGIRTQMTESSTVPKLIKLKPEEITITDKRPIPLSTAVSVQETITPPALAEFLRARLALLGRGILSSNVTRATPLTTYISTQNKSAEQSVLVAQQPDITPSVKQMSTRNKEPSVIIENNSKHTEYNIPGETKHIKSKPSSLVGTSHLRPFHWLNKPTMDFTTMKPHTKVEQVVSRTKPSTEKTKTFFSTSGMSDQIQQPVSKTETSIRAEHRVLFGPLVGHTTASSIRKPSFNLSKNYDFKKYKNNYEQGKAFFDSNIAFDKGVTGAKLLHRIRQTTKGPYAAKKTQLKQEKNYSSGSGEKGPIDSVMDRRMIQTPIKQYSQVPLSPLTMFSNNRRMSFMTLKTPRKSYISSPNPRVPDFSTTTTSTTTVLPKFNKSQSPDLGVRPDVHDIHPRIPDSQRRDINVQQQVPDIKLNPPAARPRVSETRLHVSDVEPNVYTVESHTSQVNLRPPKVKSQAPVAKPRLPKFEPEVPDVQHVNKAQSSIPDFHPRIHDVNPSVSDIQKQITDAQPHVSDVSSSVSDVQLGVSDVKPSIADIQYDPSRLLGVQSRTPGIKTHSSDVQRRVLNIHSPISDINVNTLNVPIRATDIQSHVPYVQSSVSDVKPRLTKVKPSDFDINLHALGAKPRAPKVQSRYSDVKPRAPDIKSIYPDVQPRVPVDQSTFLNDQPRVPDVQPRIPVTQSRVYDTEPLVADAHLRVPDVQTSFTYVQPRPSDVKSRLTGANSRISDIQPFVTNVQPVPVVQSHATNAEKQTPIRNTIHDLHSGNKLMSKSSTTSDIPQVSHLRSIGVHVKNSYEVGSSKEKGSVIVSLGKTNDGKVKDSSPVHIDTKGSYRTENAHTKVGVSHTTKPRIPTKDKAPHFRATTQNILKVPPNFKISDDGYHYEPSSQEVTQQKQKFSAKPRYGQRHTGNLIIEHPQHNHTMDKAAALNLCLKSRYIDGIGYTHRPDSCTDFLQCIQVNGHIKLEVGHCPMGTVFDEQSAICRPYNMHYCPRDPCAYNQAVTYGHPSNCRGYLRCQGGRSIPNCCPEGFSYSADDDTCVMNPSCTVSCLEQTPGCNSAPFKTNDNFYFENFPGFGWLIRTCPVGSRYNQALCTCQTWKESEITVECKPHVSLDFEEKFDTNKALHNKNVKVEKGAGKFEGKSMITLWRFTGVSFGTSVLITMRFKIPEPEKNNKLMHLLSNCCIGCRGRPGPTIDIAVLPDASGGVAILSSYSATSGEKFIFIPYKNTETGWNKLVYSYDGDWLVGTVNGVTGRQQMKGTIESRPYPLLLGSCGTAPSFKGYIDDFKIYLCKS